MLPGNESACDLGRAVALCELRAARVLAEVDGAFAFRLDHMVSERHALSALCGALVTARLAKAAVLRLLLLGGRDPSIAR